MTQQQQQQYQDLETTSSSYATCRLKIWKFRTKFKYENWILSPDFQMGRVSHCMLCPCGSMHTRTRMRFGAKAMPAW